MMHRPLSADPASAVVELHNIYATAPVGLCCVDRDLCYVSINDRLAAMNGIAASAHVGRTLREMVPDIAAEIEAVYRRVFATGRPEIDVALIGPAPVPGELPRTYLCSYSPVCDERDEVVAVNTVVQDVTDRLLNTTGLKAAEAALLESEARNQAILSALPDIVFLQSRDGTYLDVHPRDDPRLLLPADQFIGRNMIDILPPELGRQLQRCFEQVATEGSAHLDYALPVGGEHRHYEARMVPCGADRILAIVRDVTESKRAHHDAERSRFELAHISRLTLLGEITASLAHELNQPLTAILANAQAARYGLTTTTTAERELDDMLHEIVDAGKRAGDVIRRVRTWLTREQFLPQALDLNQVVADVERLLRSELIMRHVQLVLDLPADLPAVAADRVQLQQVIFNLALNAIDAMHECPASERRLLISTSQVETGVQVAVRDRGTGIHADHMDRLFDPFFSTKPTGLGVGLRICSSIVGAHRGRIWAENNDGAGATFFFTLPAVAPTT